MHTSDHQTLYRADYKDPEFFVKETKLTFQLYEEQTTVTSEVSYQKSSANQVGDCQLFCEELIIKKIFLDGRELSATDFQHDAKSLTIFKVPEKFKLKIVSDIFPDKNSSLEGLYRSNGNYCTQCEAEGFRKITPYLDRPATLAPFTTRIEADKNSCPVLLSNGNKIEEGELAEGRHYAIWQDPHPKPSYLFALVAGNLVAISDKYTTSSGREVDLKIFVEERNCHKCEHAMHSLKKSMKWDEEVYGLEYDLDIFMIVAVDDFNMGAMENKGLNIFNSKYVLASPATATDQDYLGIEGVIAHEYFHNWTGNRVTCRDWFQLSLKEGLTVFRDQEFSSDMNSRTVQRIDDVKVLRDYQFKEDASAMAHPIRPDSCVEINNFYTSTVYNKGAEVIRMIHTLLGAEKFRAGMDLYFKRHDGHAVTCEDFVAAMEDASGVDLTQFRNWYSQAGTPELMVKEKWDAQKSEYLLTIKQSCPATPGQESKLPFHLPIAIGLLGAAGNELLANGTEIVELRKSEETFSFKHIGERPVLSFLRDFSAPVKVTPFQSEEDMLFLLAHDSNDFVRFDTIQALFCKTIFAVQRDIQQKKLTQLPSAFVAAFKKLISDTTDDSLLARSLQLPAERYLATLSETVDVESLHEARSFVRRELAVNCQELLIPLHKRCSDSSKYDLSPQEMGKRACKNAILPYLTTLPTWWKRATDQYKSANNMTDSIAALGAICHSECSEKDDLLADFYQKWHNDPLVMDKWFAIQAGSSIGGAEAAISRVKQLMEVPEFSLTNPNKVRSLIGFFAANNHYAFHAIDGSGYQFLAGIIIELQKKNPQIAARLASAYTGWQRYDQTRQKLVKQEMELILATPDLCRDVYEIVKKLI